MTIMTMSNHDDTPTTEDPLIVCPQGAVRLSTIQSLRVAGTSAPRLVVVAHTACFDLEGESAIDFLHDLLEADPLSRVGSLLAKFCDSMPSEGDDDPTGWRDRTEDDDETVLEVVRAHGRESGLTDEQAEKLFEVAKATAHGGLNELILRFPELAEAMQDDTEDHDDTDRSMREPRPFYR